MPRPMILGMSPSRSYPERSWHESADSTKFLAKVILGDEGCIPELKKLFDMRNLNREAPPKGSSFANYDAAEARETLEEFAHENDLADRLIILLGSRVAKSFDEFAGSKVLLQRNTIVSVVSELQYVDCKVLFVRHPSYFITQRGRKAGEMLAQIAQARIEIDPPLKGALSEAQREHELSERDRLAEEQEAKIEAEFNVQLANEDYDRQVEEEYHSSLPDNDIEEDDEDEELSDEFDRYERLIDGGWEED